MTLAEIRARTIKESGRDDLVKGDGSDNGIDLLINSAVRLLDVFQDNPKSWASHHVDVVAGTIFTDIQYCRMVDEVWTSVDTLLTDLDTGRRKLIEKDLKWMKETYATIPITNVERGVPLYWAMVKTAGLPPQFFDAATAGDLPATKDVESVLFGDHYHKTRLMIMPPPDVAYTYEVTGKFFSKRLEEDTDYNYWTQMFPELVILTTSLIMEGFYRNTEGVRDWLNMINLYTEKIEFDLVEQESKNANVMRG